MFFSASPRNSSARPRLRRRHARKITVNYGATALMCPVLRGILRQLSPNDVACSIRLTCCAVLVSITPCLVREPGQLCQVLVGHCPYAAPDRLSVTGLIVIQLYIMRAPTQKPWSARHAHNATRCTRRVRRVSPQIYSGRAKAPARVTPALVPGKSHFLATCGLKTFRHLDVWASVATFRFPRVAPSEPPGAANLATFFRTDYPVTRHTLTSPAICVTSHSRATVTHPHIQPYTHPQSTPLSVSTLLPITTHALAPPHSTAHHCTPLHSTGRCRAATEIFEAVLNKTTPALPACST